jgi:hypothetical protein
MEPSLEAVVAAHEQALERHAEMAALYVEDGE